MSEAYLEFDTLKQQDRRDVYEAAAARLGTTVQSIEKDLWVCRVIDAVFKGLPRQPKPFFKGGTSLSKGYGLIKRFSEDIDIVLSPIHLQKDCRRRSARKQLRPPRTSAALTFWAR